MTREPIANAVEQIVTQTTHDHGLDHEAGIVTQASKFDVDLGMDGVDVIEVVHRTEKAFTIQIPDDYITEQSRVADLTEIISYLLKEKAERDAPAPMIGDALFDFPPEGAA